MTDTNEIRVKFVIRQTWRFKILMALIRMFPRFFSMLPQKPISFLLEKGLKHEVVQI